MLCKNYYCVERTFLSIGERPIRANFILLTFGVRKRIKGVLLDSCGGIIVVLSPKNEMVNVG